MTDSPKRSLQQDLRDARILSPHLDPTYSGDFDGTRLEDAGSARSFQSADLSDTESSLRLQGGDIHRDLYRIDARAKRAKQMKRAATFSHPTEFYDSEHEDIPPVSDQLVPGGFRRQFLERQGRRLSYIATPVTKDFISFLALYGQFAGEDLEESEDESALEDEVEAEEELVGERRPLLGRRRSTRTRAQGDESAQNSISRSV